MRRSLSIPFFLICIIAGFYCGSVFHGTVKKPISPINNMRVVESANVIVSPTPGIPITISIPKINLTTPVEQVGVDNLGRMDVPKKAADVGWYDAGFRPGAAGNATIDGHYDMATGAPAAFYYVKNLASGDTITVTDSNNKQYVFIVKQVSAYDFDHVPMDAISAATTSAHLNLITCNGVWDKVNKNYSKRLVVYADLKK